jgi:predicted metalloprotease
MGPKMAVGGGLGLVITIIALLLGQNPGVIGNMVQEQAPPTQQGEYVGTPEEEQMKEFVGVVLADTEEIWGELFAQAGQNYRQPKVVLFTGQVESACGFASAASGPFYCPPDENVYLDLSFFEEMSSKFGASGDFAAAYVIAHEVGHHVQKLLGVTDQLQAMQGRVSQEEFNQMSVRVELQADYFAGVFAHHEQARLNVIEPGDIDEALRTASAIGDDRLQKRSQGYVVPESFTHGTAEQRAAWFRRGFETGDPSQGNTFDVDYGDL